MGSATVVGVIVQALSGGWGWFSYGAKDEGVVARVRFALRPDGRLEAAEMHVEGRPDHVEGRPNLAGEAARIVPLTSMEAWANGRGYDELVAGIAETGTETEEAMDSWLKAVGGGDREPMVRLNARRQHPELRIRIPEGPKRPDSFYRKVGQVYMRAVEDGSHRPAQLIADENNLPVTTVRRWIREARVRKVMKPAQTKGRAG